MSRRQMFQSYAAHRVPVPLIAGVLRVDGSGVKVQAVSVVSVIPGRGPPIAAGSTLIVQRPIISVGIAGIDTEVVTSVTSCRQRAG